MYHMLFMAKTMGSSFDIYQPDSLLTQKNFIFPLKHNNKKK